MFKTSLELHVQKEQMYLSCNQNMIKFLQEICQWVLNLPENFYLKKYVIE